MDKKNMIIAVIVLLIVVAVAFTLRNKKQPAQETTQIEQPVTGEATTPTEAQPGTQTGAAPEQPTEEPPATTN
ncbi:MAG: hypothetical protein A2Z91_06105 [Deltaproteobacteria bacterium GWA2_38_16]|nr:MAG: hypothetical protein A2Z91_06105 [Deltaproteobacteria bacterium GWA2_38_16]OGQ03741.1 MAG: hypothetical protein A3D19_02705 [Deltaproteobacteria bacterium RIFCSPHIGHO2_02_FULL_38_15]OGQ33462.1 MAG: hypothetical protein A3A72_02475 [Deltaproteobacteria bacterium RIFCSPLOWO2_01_FULL_38_9]OGQ61963.1 MAG: hypothetical protein A3G92_06980 [Deltaproteobacteria bacterium RIFCSPLOWO2_12_FULL_38_8]HBQ21303.1 hypothetical protein [Deltaproteobacteria bacterium]